MQRQCDSCGKPYNAKRPSSRYCGETCRKRAQRAPKAPVPNVSPLPERQAEPGTLVAATIAELDSVGRLDTVLGRQAVTIAGRLESPSETASGIASLSKEFRAVMAEVLAGVQAVADPIDQLREARERKRRAAG